MLSCGEIKNEFMPTHNRNKLSVIYDKRQKDFVVKYPRKCDGSLALSHLLCVQMRFDLLKLGRSKLPYETYNFKEDLEKRGYDLSTLRFSIELKKT